MSALVVMVAIPGAGKSVYLDKRFYPSQIVCLDELREAVSDDASDQTATPDAVELQHLILSMRCRRRLLTAVDATNVRTEHRNGLLGHAHRNLMFPVAVVLDTPLGLCLQQNRMRPASQIVPDAVIHRMHQRLQETVPAEGPLPGFGQTVRIAPWGTVVHGRAPWAPERCPWLS